MNLRNLKKYDWKNYLIYYGLYTITVAFLIWLVASYINICMHNAGGDATYHYWKYNLLIIVFRLVKRIGG